MKRLLILGTIAALAFSTTAEAKPFKEKKSKRVVTSQRVINNGATTRVVSAPTRTVVRRYSSGGYGGYYGGSYGYYPYYSSGPSVSIGFGGAYGYPYGYGYGYPGYGYGYPYGYSYGYNTYPSTTYRYDRAYYYSDNVVASVQARLANAGYYHGVIDGVAGPRTHAAVATWEARHGMVADGRIDRSVLRSLGIS